MDTVKPGQIKVIAQSGIPSGADVGFQVVKAVSGLVSIPRTTAGVSNVPMGTGSYTITFTAPPESDLYLVVIDWTGGVLDEESIVLDLKVTDEVPAGDGDGLGAVAAYVKMNMGGETWALLLASPQYGPGVVAQAIDLVKERVFANPPATLAEDALPRRVLDYVAICASLELIAAARDLWMQSEISKTVGSDPSEIVTYANRAAMMNELRDDLLRRLPAAQQSALPVIDEPVLRLAEDGPAIDEDDDCRVTDDPRDFGHVSTLALDSYGPARPSGAVLP